MPHTVSYAGLFRCCLAFIAEENEQPHEDGDEVRCPHCGDRIILRHGVWQWAPSVTVRTVEGSA